MNKNLLLFSTSTIFGSSYLEYNREVYKRFFTGCESIVFIPYARPSGLSYEEYSAKAKAAFATAGLRIRGIEEFADPKEAVMEADGVFVGGGNTFVLLDTLFRTGLHGLIKKRAEGGLRYMGSSAGTNIAGVSIGNTNDMPVIYPPSFEALELVPFNFNPHYLDPEPGSSHMGETRETRISEFHVYNDIPVVGLREGSWIECEGGKIKLGGALHARIFRKDKQAEEYAPESDINFLLSGS